MASATATVGIRGGGGGGGGLGFPPIASSFCPMRRRRPNANSNHLINKPSQTLSFHNHSLQRIRIRIRGGRQKMAAAHALPLKPLPLPEPDGGALVDLVVPESERAARRAEAATMPAVQIGRVDLEWVHVLADGWASPLRGFMTDRQYLQSLHFNTLRMEDGSFVSMPLPIVLAVTEADRQAMLKNRSGGGSVALVGPSGNLVAIQRGGVMWRQNKKERIARTWGMTALGQPYVEEVIDPAGDYLIGGDLEVLEPIKYNDGLDHYRLSPRQLREEFKSREADAVVAFQLRRPLHNGCVMFLNDTRMRLLEMGYKNPIVLLHPLGGFTKSDGLPLAVLMEHYSKVLEDGVLDPATTILAIFPSPMNYPGPKELIWRAKALINAGANFYITDEHPRGISIQDTYHLEDAECVLHMAPGLDKLNILPLWEAQYDKKNKKAGYLESSRPEDFLFIGEKEMRRYATYATNGENPPHGFMSPGGWKVLFNYYKNLQSEEMGQQWLRFLPRLSLPKVH